MNISAILPFTDSISIEQFPQTALEHPLQLFKQALQVDPEQDEQV